MHKKSNSNVGIVIPTKDRPEFVSRLLDYYSSLASPHPIYLADSSTLENVKLIRDKIKKLEDKVKVHYQFYPPGDTIQCFIGALRAVKEKYACYIGDDDFQVPSTLTECTNFLENNPDYSSAIGLSLTFKIADNSAYGEPSEIRDYPRISIEGNTAAERMASFLGPRPAPTINSVCRTKDLLESFEKSVHIKDMSFKGELLPSIFILINGKLNVMDKVGFVRQIHSSHYKLPDFFDWLTGNDWQNSFTSFQTIVVSELVIKDKIPQSVAKQYFKKAFWNFLSSLLQKYEAEFSQRRWSGNSPKGLRAFLVLNFPFMKKLRYNFLRYYLGRVRLSYEVEQPTSPYYADFEPIRKLLRGRIETIRLHIRTE